MFFPRARIWKVGRFCCVLTAPIMLPMTGGYGHHSPRTSPLAKAMAVLCVGQTRQSSQPSSATSDFWEVEPATGRRSMRPVSSGVPRWGQELDMQASCLPSLETTMRRSNPPATTGTMTPGAMRVFGHTTIHSPGRSLSFPPPPKMPDRPPKKPPTPPPLSPSFLLVLDLDLSSPSLDTLSLFLPPPANEIPGHRSLFSFSVDFGAPASFLVLSFF